MKTSKAISTISYNTEKFLTKMLKELQKDGYISFWYYVKHKAEDDEKKDHIHLYIEPAKPIDTIQLEEISKEYPKGDLTKKPLKCQPFRKSKTDEALLYNLHDVRYLQIKWLVKKYNYNLKDVKTSDKDYLETIYREALESPIFKQFKILELFDNGITLPQLVVSGYIKPNETYYLQSMWQLYKMGIKEKFEENEKNA